MPATYSRLVIHFFDLVLLCGVNGHPRALIGLHEELRPPTELPGATGSDNPEKEEFTLEKELEEEEGGEEQCRGGQRTVLISASTESRPRPSQKWSRHLLTGSVGFLRGTRTSMSLH